MMISSSSTAGKDITISLKTLQISTGPFFGERACAGQAKIVDIVVLGGINRCYTGLMHKDLPHVELAVFVLRIAIIHIMANWKGSFLHHRDKCSEGTHLQGYFE